MTLLAPSRRGFIGGAAALFCAPALVRSGLIMPIKPGLVAPPALDLTACGMLSPEMIAKEMARQLVLAGARAARGFLQMPGFPEMKQSHVDCLPTKQDLAAGLDWYTERFLKPAARNLAAVAENVGPAPMMIRGLDEIAIGRHAGVEVRYIRAYDIAWDHYVTRFDVIHS